MDTKLRDYIARCADRYLSFRPRTEHEMKVYLQRKLARREELEAEQRAQLIDTKIAELKNESRIDDEAFVRWYVAEKNYFKPRGRIRLKHDLSALGVDRNLLDTILQESEVTDHELITQLLETKYARVSLDDEESYEKLIQRLQRRGFSYNDIKSAIEDYRKKE